MNIFIFTLILSLYFYNRHILRILHDMSEYLKIRVSETKRCQNGKNQDGTFVY